MTKAIEEDPGRSKHHHETYPVIPSRTTTINQTTAGSAELKGPNPVPCYELYEQRGRENGHDLEDWLRAESEVTQKKAKAAAASS